MIDTRIVGLQHALKCSFRHGLSDSGRTRSDDCLRTDSGCICWDISCQAVGEGRLSKAEEQGSSKQLTEHDDSHADGGLGSWKCVLHCDNRLRGKLSQWRGFTIFDS